ncbi:MAG: efflux transporter, family, subunit [Planctomycetaceae bacterium]|nr:efflux transporter, family, subunit [Planctomycetaceae bacterium]
MGGTVDLSTRDLAQLRLKLADHLTFAPNRYGGTTYFHLEDRAGSQYFRLGYSEYVFISLLDGATTVSEALAATARILGRNALSEAHATAICSWLIRQDLVQTSGSSIRTATNRPTSKPAGSLLQSVFWTRIPLCHPDSLLKQFVPFCGWLYAPVTFVAWLLVMACAAFAVSGQWDRVVAASSGVFSSGAWYQLVIAWAFLKVFHELSHGLACRRFEGRVGAMGIVLILLAPLAYIDVSASWQLCSKWQRIIVAAAGIYMDLWITALAAILWAQTSSVVYASFLHGLVMMGIVTLIFNGNPLIRSDGYYILADILEIPNLANRSAMHLKRWCLRWLFGVHQGIPDDVSWRYYFMLGYAVAALVWRVLVCVSLVLGCTVMWQGAGLIVSLIGVFCWGFLPLGQFLSYLWHLARTNVPSLLRGLTFLTIAASVSGLLNYIPWPTAFQSPGIVEYSDLASVRACVQGFIKSIHVHDGQVVREGELLLELSSAELKLECRDLELAVDQAEAKFRVAQNSGQFGTAQVEEQNRQALARQLEEKVHQLSQLEVRAPRSGRIITRQLASRQGTFAKEGDILLEIGDEEDKEIRFSVAQRSLFAFEREQQVAVRLMDGTRFQGALKTLSPRGSDEPPHPALCAPLSGPLTVVERAATDDKQKHQKEYRFPEPRMSGTCSIPQSVSTTIHAGSIVSVSPIGSRQTIGQALFQWMSVTWKGLNAERDAL